MGGNKQSKLADIMEAGSAHCYAKRWDELLSEGAELLKNNDETTAMITWMIHGGFAALHGGRAAEYLKIFDSMRGEINKRIGNERADRVLSKWIKEAERYRATP